jgi:PIN domain nuclease of toxin-antitoxin system
MVLLDTHVLLWMLFDDDKLSRRAIETLQNDACSISMASIWELGIKISIGKLKLPKTLAEITAQCESMGIEIHDITVEDCMCLQTLPWIHRDPFDRIIIAHAINRSTRLISHDENIHRYQEVDVVW